MKLIFILLTLTSLNIHAGKSANVEYINITPSNFNKIGFVPGYNMKSSSIVQKVKIRVNRKDGFGTLGNVILVYYQNNEIILTSQEYHHCPTECNHCFFEFSVKLSELPNIAIELNYLNLSKKPHQFRNYRVTGLKKH